MTKVAYIGFLLICAMQTNKCRAYVTTSTKHEGIVYVDSERPIMSKNFPRQYPNYEYIKYHVQAPPAKVIKLEIKHLDVEGNMSGGCHDKLEISEAVSANKTTLLRKLCGCFLPSPIYSTGNTMDIIFDTDSSTTQTGFYALISFSETNGQSKTGREFSLPLSICSLVITLSLTTVSLLLCCQFHKRLLHLELKVSGRNGRNIEANGNKYHPIGENDRNKSADTPDESETIGGYIRMRSSKTHLKQGVKPQEEEEEEEEEEKVYDVPDALVDETKSPKSSPAEYARSLFSHVENQQRSGDLGQEQPTLAQYEQPRNIIPNLDLPKAEDTLTPNTYYSPEAFAAIETTTT